MSEQRIAYPDNPIMAAAWLGSVRYAAMQAAIREQFRTETGHDLANVLNARGLDKSIDDATAHGKDVFDAFVDWHTAKIWGENPFPPASSEAA
jgi:hypothetical protein